MKDFKLNLTNGQSVVLTAEDMQKVHDHFKVQSTADYLRENHNWSEETIQKVACLARDIMNKADDGAEDEAIAEAMKKLNIEEEDRKE